MIIKSSSYKQIIIPMSKNNIDKFITKSSKYVSSMNRAFKSIKFNMIMDFIYIDYHGLIITAN